MSAQSRSMRPRTISTGAWALSSIRTARTTGRGTTPSLMRSTVSRERLKPKRAWGEPSWWEDAPGGESLLVGGGACCEAV